MTEKTLFHNNESRYQSRKIVGTGQDLSIADLSNVIAEVNRYQGTFVYDVTKPDVTPRKLLSPVKLNNLGWAAKTKLKDGIKIAHQDFLARNL